MNLDKGKKNSRGKKKENKVRVYVWKRMKCEKEKNNGK